MPDIAIIGELNLDLIVTGAPRLPLLGEELLVGDMLLTLGSSSAILACQLAKLGAEVLFVTKVGGDEFGRRALAFLQEKRVPTHAVEVLPEMPSGLTVAVSVGTERAMLTRLGTIEEMRADDIDWEVVSQCRHLHLSSYYLQRGLQPDFAPIFAKARSLGMTTSLDTGWPSDDDDHIVDLLEVWPQVDVFLPNESEAVRLSGRPTVDAALLTLSARIFTVAAKLGPNGSVARRRGQVVRSPGFRIDVVDTTGAGDSFNGGFLYGYLHGWDLRACLDLGNAAGALSTRGPGGTTTQATLAEAQEFIRTAPRRE